MQLIGRGIVYSFYIFQVVVLWMNQNLPCCTTESLPLDTYERDNEKWFDSFFFFFDREKWLQLKYVLGWTKMIQNRNIFQELTTNHCSWGGKSTTPFIQSCFNQTQANSKSSRALNLQFFNFSKQSQFIFPKKKSKCKIKRHSLIYSNNCNELTECFLFKWENY